jgi:GT2 family glycosyltransferase
MLRENPEHDIFLVVTSDVLVDPALVKEFVERMRDDRTLTLVGGKVHHWDLKTMRKTNVLDSLGIGGQRRHHFYDRGHGEMDQGQYDDELEDFFGISGAVFLLRTAAVPRLHGSAHEIFDERMWMYKEDIDLSYRLRWLGEGIKIFPEVWAWHGRTVANKEGNSVRGLSRADRTKRDYARLHSYKNHLLLLKNNFTWRYGVGTLARVLVYEFLKGAYMLFRHPAVFFAGLKTLLFVPGKRSARAISPKEMLSYFD